MGADRPARLPPGAAPPQANEPAGPRAAAGGQPQQRPAAPARQYSSDATTSSAGAKSGSSSYFGASTPGVGQQQQHSWLRSPDAGFGASLQDQLPVLPSQQYYGPQRGQQQQQQQQRAPVAQHYPMDNNDPNQQQQHQRVQFLHPLAPSATASSSKAALLDDDDDREHQRGTRNQHTGSGADFKRKRSLVRPDRERINPDHRLYNYRTHAAQMEAEGRGVAEMSRTGHLGYHGIDSHLLTPTTAAVLQSRQRAQQQAENEPLSPPAAAFAGGRIGSGSPASSTTLAPAAPIRAPGAGASVADHLLERDAGAGSSSARPSDGVHPTLGRGKSLLGREEGMNNNETGLRIFHRAATLRRSQRRNGGAAAAGANGQPKVLAKPKKAPIGPWMIYCNIITCCFPAPVLKCFGLKTKDRQRAWREKMGLLGIIMCAMTFVGFITFGFTQSVCGKPPLRYRTGAMEGGMMIYHGYNYDFDNFSHPAANGIEGGSNPLYDEFAAGGKDGSFLFQTVNENCLDIITPADGSGIPSDGNRLGWYFPCNLYDQYGTSSVNLTGYAEGAMCHTQTDARTEFAALKPLGQVYFEWSDLKNSSRNLGVYDGNVLDFALLRWLDSSQVSYPAMFDNIKNGNSSFQGRDITAMMVSSNQVDVARCMVDTIRVGFVDSESIGCVASDVVLYFSLVFIIGVVAIRFAMALYFNWFLSWRIGAYKKESKAQRRARAQAIEQWTDDIYRPAPARYRPNANKLKKTILPTKSRFSQASALNKQGDFRKSAKPFASGGSGNSSPTGGPGGLKSSRSSMSLPMGSALNLDSASRRSSSSIAAEGMMGTCPYPLINVVPQPPPDHEPFGYPLAHMINLVTAYSESVEGLRTTLDSLATTDYPNSHKLLMVIADGMVKGSGNDLTTPDIVLGMMKEFVTPPEEVEALSYIAIADGHKRHNLAKVYAGFYEYDNNTVEMSKQQRVPIVLVAKVGNPLEAHEAKPGNRGKRDSQIVLMAFLQKVMFDERMTTFEYEFFNAIWRCTGVSPDRYEIVLCVDADTKVFPDSISRMISCMVHDPEIMGLCGETKIANKTETWVTMIQVFEYFVSHNLTKAFESFFGGVTCLPGCFSMYRIKAPKGNNGYWVPILANPDIVEHYSENVVDTLHRKNLLLLGEDRYLSTLMLRTFPRRKMMYCPQAVCKTIVPDTFRVLLSQRRRWINSTIHNLYELLQVRDLCGTFCFSMQFVVFMELAGTLVLPAAIAFTLYLLIFSMIPGTVKPVIPLILLAIILGLPGILIVATCKRFSYLLWMLVYLISLPIWNFVLPGYAFLHMDDFSWGATRAVVGEKKGANHGDKEGEFDSSNIVMKRWAEFERDRRVKAGLTRDSTFDLGRNTSPHRMANDRYSTISSADTYHSSGERVGYPGSPAYPVQLELPAPLATQGRSPPLSTASMRDYEDLSPPPPPPPELPSKAPSYGGSGYDEYEYDRDTNVDSPIISQTLSLAPHNDEPTSFFGGERESSPSLSPLEGRSSPSAVVTSPVDIASSSSSQHSRGDSRAPSKFRGVSLVDDGPVPGTAGFRPVQRARRESRNSTTMPPPSRGGRSSVSHAPSDARTLNTIDTSHSSTTMSPPPSARSSLPPGAAPPQFRPQ